VKGFALLTLAAVACGPSAGSDREVRLQRLAGEHRALMEQLEDLQARILVDRERVRFWTEMRERHESVSAIACTSQAEHAIAMAMAERPQPEAQKPGAMRLRARVASVRPDATPAAVRRR
jgi:hypothetical protein